MVDSTDHLSHEIMDCIAILIHKALISITLDNYPLE
jgi:hypothetical protein